TTHEGEGARSRGRARSVRHDAAFDHSRARDVSNEVPCVPGRAVRNRRKGDRGAEEGAGGSESLGPTMLDRWVRLWFGFRDPVDRGTYFRHGVGLMALKYAIDALLVFFIAHQVWSPFTYLSPLLSVRATLLHTAPRWLLPLMVAIALPFLWIGVSMTMRRAVDAGTSPWLALLFFVPGLNLALMLVLSLLPSRPPMGLPADVSPTVGSERFRSAMLGVAASLAITLLSVG